MRVDLNLLSYKQKYNFNKNSNKSLLSNPIKDEVSFASKKTVKDSISKIEKLILDFEMTYDKNDFDKMMNWLKKHPFIKDTNQFVDAHYSIFYAVFILSEFYKKENKELIINDNDFQKDGFNYLNEIIEDNNLPFKYLNIVALDIDENLPLDEIKRKIKYIADGTYEKRKNEFSKYNVVDEYNLNMILGLNEKDYSSVLKLIKNNPNFEKYLLSNKMVIDNFIIRKINNSDEHIFEITFATDNIKIIQLIYPDGTIEVKRQETDEEKKPQIVTSFEKNKQNKFLQTLSTPEVEIDYLEDRNGSLSALLVLRPSKYIDGLYDIKSYHLSDYPYSQDVLDDILKNNLQNGRTISKSYTQNGINYFDEDYYSNGYKILRNFSVNQTDASYKGIKKFPNVKNSLDKKFNFYSYDYSIKNKEGKEILSLHRKFIRLSKTKTCTTINDKKYIAEFDDKTKTITIKTDDKTVVIDIEKRIDNSNNTEASKKIIWEHLKNLPADILLNIEKCINDIIFDDCTTGKYYIDDKNIEIIPNITTYSHELGHALDYNMNISDDKHLLKIYQKELQDFEDSQNYEKRCSIAYFSQTGGNRFSSGIKELIAETYSLLVFPCNSEKGLRKRMQLLIHNFPETISYIASKLGLNAILE